MSSLGKMKKSKRSRRDKKQNRRRKNLMSARSTEPAVEFFAALGEPGKPAPKKSV
ncbi:MAG: hypothetical protein J7M25_05270 [Deltaproteobacteria bacterium]|nr:hypothetical protein [Deltaproteobacteria bacterium]